VPEAREAVDGWLAWAAEGEQQHRRLVELSTQAHQVVARGTSNEQRMLGRVPDYDDLRRLLKALRRRPALPLPATFVAEFEAAEAAEADDE
jgi:hypothetical protein